MAKTLAELINEKFGVKTDAKENPVTNSVGTTPTLILGNNPNRVAFLIVNLSPNTIYMARERDVSPSKGVVITPNGGSVSMIFDEDFQAVGYEWYGVADAVSPIYVLEVNIIE